MCPHLSAPLTRTGDTEDGGVRHGRGRSAAGAASPPAARHRTHALRQPPHHRRGPLEGAVLHPRPGAYPRQRHDV
eukprot:8292753-Pyramimonas_sp.AAC.2